MTVWLHRELEAAETVGIDGSEEMLSATAIYADEHLRFEYRGMVEWFKGSALAPYGAALPKELYEQLAMDYENEVVSLCGEGGGFPDRPRVCRHCATSGRSSPHPMRSPHLGYATSMRAVRNVPCVRRLPLFAGSSSS
jgi:hypothetical protein